MGVFAGTKIAENQLDLSIDFGNSKSYPGFGSTITSLVEESSFQLSSNDSFYRVYDPITTEYIFPDAPAKNLPVFTSNNFGTITFDGTGNNIEFSVPSLGSRVTVELWAKIGTDYANKMMLNFGFYNIWTLNGGLGFNTSNNDLYGISSANVTSLGLVDQWNHYVFEMRTDISYTNNKIYINSQLQSLSQQIGTELSTNRNFNDTNGRIASFRRSPLLYNMPMEFSFMRIYDRSLTEEEVYNNFISSKTRFGL